MSSDPVSGFTKKIPGCGDPLVVMVIEANATLLEGVKVLQYRVNVRVDRGGSECAVTTRFAELEAGETSLKVILVEVSAIEFKLVDAPE